MILQVVFQSHSTYFYSMNTDQLKEVYSPESFRKEGHLLIDLMADHLESTLNARSSKVIDWELPEDERLYWQEYEFKTNQEFFTDLLRRIIHIHHPKYMGHQISPSIPVTGLTSLVSALVNNGMGIYEMGAAPTAMERVATDMLCEILGYTAEARGILTSGGTLANLTALLSARRRYIESNGQPPQLAVMVSEEAHYCIDRATKIMGLGEMGIIKVPTSDNFQLKTELLEEYYDRAKEKGQAVFALVGCAPSTATGVYDDLAKMAEFASREDIWFHVDGAHGGAAIFSAKYKSLLDGIEQADSVVIDGHKMMMMPGITTALLFKNGSDSHNTFRQKAEYLLEESEEEDWYNLAKRTFECTKHMMSLHWYISLKQYGNGIFDDFLTRLYDQAAEFAMILDKETDFELATAPMSNILCFRYTGSEVPEGSINEFNRSIRQKILESGEFYIVQTKLRGKQYLRTTIMNPFSTEEHFRGLISHIRELATSF